MSLHEKLVELHTELKTAPIADIAKINSKILHVSRLIGAV